MSEINQNLSFGPIMGQFMSDFESKVAVLGGPTGVGKSMALGYKLLLAAQFMQAHKGVRRSHFLIARPSSGDVRESLVKDLEDEIFPPIVEAGGIAEFVGQYPIKGELKFRLPDNTIVECEITAAGFEDVASAKKRLKSKKYTCALIPEMQTFVERGILDEILHRVDRFPTDKDGGIRWEIPRSDGSIMYRYGGKTWGGVNYTDRRHWFYDYMVTSNLVREDGSLARKFFELPSALIAEPDPESNLIYKGEPVRFIGNPLAAPYVKHTVKRDEKGEKIPGSEYSLWLEQAEQLSGDDAAIDENIMGVWGSRTKGKPVYGKFSQLEQVSRFKLEPNTTAPVWVGTDGGFNNAFVFGQEGFNGKLNILDCINNTGDRAKSIRQALDEDVLPLLNSCYVGCDITFVLDPSMFYRDGTDGDMQAEEFFKKNLKAISAPTQSPADRIEDGGWFIDRRGVLQISRNCIDLVDALAGGYHYKLKKSGMYEDTPNKNSEFSHIGDAYQYLCSQLRRGFARRAKPSTEKKRRSLHRW